MESVVKHSREVVTIDPYTGAETIKQEKVWNFTIVDISFLAFGISFPQISLATIDAIRNLGNLYGGAGESKKISDIGVWLVELFWSFWAYIWLYIILEVWTPNVITIWEALLAVLQYGLLPMHAYAQDKRWPYLSIPLEISDIPKEWMPIEVASSKLDNCDCYSDLQDAENSNGSVVDISENKASHGLVHPAIVIALMGRGGYVLLLTMKSFGKNSYSRDDIDVMRNEWASHLGSLIMLFGNNLLRTLITIFELHIYHKTITSIAAGRDYDFLIGTCHTYSSNEPNYIHFLRAYGFESSVDHSISFGLFVFPSSRFPHKIRDLQNIRSSNLVSTQFSIHGQTVKRNQQIYM
ncbi:hypothetical protein UlMin_011029 [Ulmus minor]